MEETSKVAEDLGSCLKQCLNHILVVKTARDFWKYGDLWADELRTYLRSFGFGFVYINIKNVAPHDQQSFLASHIPGVSILCVETFKYNGNPESRHCVVIENGVITYDPRSTRRDKLQENEYPKVYGALVFTALQPQRMVKLQSAKK